MVLACEMLYMPVPRIEIFPDSTKVTLFPHMEFANIPMEDKLWSCYLHACLMYIQRDGLTNSSLRKRFGVKDSLPGAYRDSSRRLLVKDSSNLLIRIPHHGI